MSQSSRSLTTLEALSCALPEGEAGQRMAEIGQLLAQRVNAWHVDSGVELEYAGDDTTARALFDFVMFERRCCAQLSFELRFVPDHRTVRLRVTGAPELVAPIRAFAGLAE